MDTLAFHFDAYGGWGEVKGVAGFDEHGLLLQFTTSDALFGVLKSGLREVRLPIEALRSVQYRAGFLWLMPAIELRVRELSALKDLPESEQGRLRLRVAFRDRHEAREFAQELDRWRSLRRIAELDRNLDRLGVGGAASAPGHAATPAGGHRIGTSTPARRTETDSER